MNYRMLIILLMIVVGCDMPYEPGPMPKQIVDTQYVERLNIMGVLRLDDELGSSFVHVQRTMTTEEIYTLEADPAIRNAVVTVIDRSSNDQWIFQHSTDSLYSGYYYDSTFTPLSGRTYELTVTSDTLPILTASTTIPQKPYLNNYFIEHQSRKVVLDLLLTSSTYQYNIYLLFRNDVIEKVLEGGVDSMATIGFTWDAAMGDPQTIMITGLDENLTRYGNSSTSIIPNTYQQDGSTVANGYGCFGAVSVTIIRLTNP